MLDFFNMGFGFDEEEQLDNFLDKALTQSTVLSLPGGKYALYQQPDGFQCWFPLDDQNCALDFDVHFASAQHNTIKIRECLNHRVSERSGLYRCSIDLDEGDGYMIPDVPVNLWLPAVGMVAAWEPGKTYQAQIVCIPKNIRMFSDKTEHGHAAKEGTVSFAAEHFVPAGTFSPRDDDLDFEQNGWAILGGRVTRARRLTNPFNGLPYDHVQITSLGLHYDILAHPSMYTELPRPGNILHGMFMLSAFVWDMDAPLPAWWPQLE